MSIKEIITGGFGTFTSIANLIWRGYKAAPLQEKTLTGNSYITETLTGDSNII